MIKKVDQLRYMRAQEALRQDNKEMAEFWCKSICCPSIRDAAETKIAEHELQGQIKNGL